VPVRWPTSMTAKPQSTIGAGVSRSRFIAAQDGRSRAQAVEARASVAPHGALACTGDGARTRRKGWDSGHLATNAGPQQELRYAKRIVFTASSDFAIWSVKIGIGY